MPADTAVAPVAVLEVNVSGALMNPNPVTNKAMLSVQAKMPMNVSWKIFDMNGRMVMAFNTQLQTSENEIELDLGNLLTGSYYLVGYTTKGTFSPIRFMKL
jgi:hypothetical protein